MRCFQIRMCSRIQSKVTVTCYKYHRSYFGQPVYRFVGVRCRLKREYTGISCWLYTARSTGSDTDRSQHRTEFNRTNTNRAATAKEALFVLSLTLPLIILSLTLRTRTGLQLLKRRYSHQSLEHRWAARTSSSGRAENRGGGGEGAPP